MPTIATVERSILIDAPADRITPFIADLHRWSEWSPWEGHDPNLQRTYSGTPGTVGSTYAWKGNRKAGAGSMAITGIEAAAIDVDLVFTAPFRSTGDITFRLAEQGPSTTVVWTMTSSQTGTARIMSVVISLDKLIGGDFERGLTNLKTVVERD